MTTLTMRKPSLFWRHIVDQERVASAETCCDNLKKRAIKEIEKIESTNGKPKFGEIDRVIKICEEYSLTNNDFKEIKCQEATLRNSVPEESWAIASNWLETDRQGAMTLLATDTELRMEVMTLDYFFNLLKLKKSSRSIDKFMFLMNSDSVLKMMAAHGGAEHFLHYALSMYMWFAFNTNFAKLVGGSNMFSDYAFPKKAMDYLENSKSWNESNRLRLRIINSLVPEVSQLYVKEIATSRRAELNALEEMRLLVSSKLDEVSARAKENFSLTKKNEKLTVQLEETRNRLIVCQDDVSKFRSHRPLTLRNDSSEVVDELIANNRTLEKTITQKDALLFDVKSENDSLKSFISVLLRSNCDTAQSKPEVKVSGSPKDWRIAVIGGHERLHSKLRKAMPRSVFFHPDRSQIGSEELSNIDAAIYCVGYCSHKLYERASQEIRKNGIRVGYTNSTNVEKVIEDIREIIEY